MTHRTYCAKFRSPTPDNCLKICAFVRGCELERATPNYLVLGWNRHFRVNFTSKQAKLQKTFEFLDQMFCTCFSDYSGTHHLILSFEVFCTAFRGSSYWDPRKPVEDGGTLNCGQKYKFSFRGINTCGTAKFEDDLSFPSQNIRETITRLPGSLVRTTRGKWKRCSTK